MSPSNLEKPIKLQLPILLATYPLRNEDGTIRRWSNYATYAPWVLFFTSIYKQVQKRDYGTGVMVRTVKAWGMGSVKDMLPHLEMIPYGWMLKNAIRHIKGTVCQFYKIWSIAFLGSLARKMKTFKSLTVNKNSNIEKRARPRITNPWAHLWWTTRSRQNRQYFKSFQLLDPLFSKA